MHKLLTSLLILGAFALSCFAQKESLLIGPGDLLYVEVFDTPEMAQEVRVSDSGTVRLTFVGTMKVLGETPASASKMIEQALIDQKVMLHPQVKVRVEEYATQDVSVLGQVQTPGTFPITTAQPVLKILSLAGGLTGTADRNITVERHGDPKQQIKYYLSNDSDAALNNSVMVYPGDTVIVPRAALVWIMGDVAHPGGYPINTNESQLTILQAVALAGSVNKTAAQSHVRLIRKTPQGQEDMTIQLADIEKGKKPDVAMQTNDILYVPFSWMKNIAVSGSAIVSSTSSAAIYAIK